MLCVDPRPLRRIEFGRASSAFSDGLWNRVVIAGSVDDPHGVIESCGVLIMHDTMASRRVFVLPRLRCI